MGCWDCSKRTLMMAYYRKVCSSQGMLRSASHHLNFADIELNHQRRHLSKWCIFCNSQNQLARALRRNQSRNWSRSSSLLDLRFQLTFLRSHQSDLESPHSIWWEYTVQSQNGLGYTHSSSLRCRLEWLGLTPEDIVAYRRIHHYPSPYKGCKPMCSHSH